MRLVALVLVTGCWGATAQPVAPQSPTNEVIVSSPSGGGYTGPASRTPFPLHSVWEGTYVCGQGLSYVKLTIDAHRSGSAVARYDFGPVPTNKTVPEGAYLMTGSIRSTRFGFAAELEPTEWIIHPPTYLYVGLSIETNGREMTGTISHVDCRDFAAKRIE